MARIEAFHLRGERLAKRGSHPQFFDSIPLRAVRFILYTQNIPHTAVEYWKIWVTMA
jgi:hypothetical protein